MGRGKAKIKFDVRDLLFPEQHINEQETVQALIRSPLFSVITQVYNQSEKFLRVGKITKGAGGEVIDAEMVSPLGFLVCRLAVSGVIGNGGSVNLYMPYHPMSLSADTNYLSTANPRYLQSKVKPDVGHPAGTGLKTKIDRAKNLMPDTLRYMLDTMIDRVFGESISSAPVFDVTKVHDSTSTFMARYMAGEVTLAEMPQNVRTNFKEVYDKYIEKCNKFKDSIQKGKDFVDGEKWVYITNVNGGVVLGAIHPGPMLAALDVYAAGGSLPDFDSEEYKIVETVPFKWYKSFDHIPDEYRVGLEYSLVMLKTHTGASKLLPEPSHTYKFWQEMGCCTTGGVSNDAQFMYLSR